MGVSLFIRKLRHHISRLDLAHDQLSPTATISVSQLFTMLEIEVESFLHFLCELVLMFPIKFIIIIKFEIGNKCPPDILELDSLDSDAPGVSGLLKQVVHLTGNGLPL